QSAEYKGLNYDAFAVMAIKALQEQQLEITDLNTKLNNQQLENETLRNELDDLRALVEQLLDKQDQQHDTSITLNQVPALQQNEPNPTTGMTRVGYFLPEGKSGELRINSISGQELQRIPLPTVGAGHIDLQTRNLPAGTYTYSLIVDDQLIDTKRMIRQ
ncbi:MAG: T9SS type A sorting domain-containing protein, partial [Saprospiraceae bacterium]|nr:T9SS type A sorting domain-containing protein [Saprospiraceae bacterium]